VHSVCNQDNQSYSLSSIKPFGVGIEVKHDDRQSNFPGIDQGVVTSDGAMLLLVLVAALRRAAFRTDSLANTEEVNLPIIVSVSVAG